MSTARDDFAAHCVELLAPLGDARAQRMFGGHGLYLDGLMIGLLTGEQLYLKTDAQTVEQWQTAGARPFVYESKRGGTTQRATMSYWSAPDEALDSPAAMQPWARLAFAAALRAHAARSAKPRAARKSR